MSRRLSTRNSERSNAVQSLSRQIRAISDGVELNRAQRSNRAGRMQELVDEARENLRRRDDALLLRPARISASAQYSTGFVALKTILEQEKARREEEEQKDNDDDDVVVISPAEQARMVGQLLTFIKHINFNLFFNAQLSPTWTSRRSFAMRSNRRSNNHMVLYAKYGVDCLLVGFVIRRK